MNLRKIGQLVGLLLFITHLSMGQVTMFLEDFESEANGATTGTATGTPGGTWSTTYGGTGTFSRQNVPIAGNVLYASNLGSEAVWTSNNMDISSAGYAIISADVWSALVENNDYVRMYYRVDGGPEVLFYELIGGNALVDLAPATPASAIVSGDNLQIVVRVFNSFSIFIVFQIPDLYAIDNITVTSADILYSAKSGSWTDVTGGFGGTGTWSANASGTPACGCLPLNDVVAVIQNGHTVTLPNSLTDVDPVVTNPAPGAVDIRSGGVLQFNTNGVTLGIQSGLLRVRNGGTLNSSSGAITGEQVSFNANVGGASLQVDTGGSAAFEDLVLGAAATNTHFISGGGSLTITDDIIINADNATLTNNLTSSLSVADRINFSAGTTGSEFVNAGTLTATSAYFDDDTNTFTNNGPLTLTDITVNDNADDNSTFANTSTLAVTSINPNSGDFFITNSGTINQTGNFSNLVAASDFTNQTGGTWNWSFATTTLPANINSVLICSATGNTFNYTASGDQTIAGVSYYHLGTSGSGTKTLSATTAVGGNLSISGSATMAPLTFALTVSGTTTISSGAFSDTNNSAVDTFVGNVSISLGASFTSTAVNSPSNMIFRGGIANAGTFSAGAATFDTNPQALTGSSAFSFANAISISGIVLTNSSTGALTVTGTTTLTGGGFTDNDNTSVTTFVGAVSQSGASSFTTTGIITGSNLIFQGGITNNGGTFTAGSATFNTNNQSLLGNTAMTFANTVTVTGITLTNSNTASVSLTQSGAISLTGTGTWTQGTTTNTLNYAGSSIDITTFNASGANNTVNYNSTTSAQTIRVPSSSSTYTNLTLNNSSGSSPQFTLGGNTTVSGVLTMTAGVVNLAGSRVTLSSSAAGALVHGLTSTSGWMYGTSPAGIVRTFAGSTAITVGNVRGFFPLGTVTDFRPFFVGVNNNAGSAGSITVTHTDANSTTPVSINDAGTTILYRHDAFWTPTTTATGGTWTMRLGGGNFGTITSNTHLRLMTASGVVGTHAAGSGAADPDWRANRTGLTVAQLGGNNFHLASSNASSPLPIELLSFDGEQRGNEIQFDWTTASELNNDYFSIERLNARDGFDLVTTVPGSGTTTETSHYSTVDASPKAGKNYYRLKQTDFDGKFTYSSLVMVEFTGKAEAFALYPNPMKDSDVTLDLDGLRPNQSVEVLVTTSAGGEALRLTAEANGLGSLKVTIPRSQLPPGLYLVRTNQSQYATKKLVVE